MASSPSSGVIDIVPSGHTTDPNDGTSRYEANAEITVSISWPNEVTYNGLLVYANIGTLVDNNGHGFAQERLLEGSAAAYEVELSCQILSAFDGQHLRLQVKK